MRGPMSIDEIIKMATGSLAALAEVHEQGIVHRDLKPDNIFLAKDKKHGFIPKVLDFGVAKDTSDGQLSKLTATGAVVGTAYYLSPEQAKGLPDIDARADVYAMGVVLFECLSGKMPYEAETITQLIAKMFTEPPRMLSTVAPNVPSPIADVVTTCLQQDRQHRYHNARGMLEALETASAVMAGHAPQQMNAQQLGVAGTAFGQHAGSAGALGAGLRVQPGDAPAADADAADRDGAAGDVRLASGVAAGDVRLASGVAAGDARLASGVAAGDARLASGVAAGVVRLAPRVAAGDAGLASGDARLASGVEPGDVRPAPGVEPGDAGLASGDAGLAPRDAAADPDDGRAVTCRRPRTCRPGSAPGVGPTGIDAGPRGAAGAEAREGRDHRPPRHPLPLRRGGHRRRGVVDDARGGSERRRRLRRRARAGRRAADRDGRGAAGSDRGDADRTRRRPRRRRPRRPTRAARRPATRPPRRATTPAARAAAAVGRGGDDEPEEQVPGEPTPQPLAATHPEPDQPAQNPQQPVSNPQPARPRRPAPGLTQGQVNSVVQEASAASIAATRAARAPRARLGRHHHHRLGRAPRRQRQPRPA